MQISKDYIIGLLTRNDDIGRHAVGRALVVLYKNQTRDERQVQHTRHLNGMGFTPSDAKRGTSMAEFYMKTGFLTEKQWKYWALPAFTESKRVRISKYWRQLLEAAEAKQKDKIAA